jgi:hypothetical protein
MDTLKPPISLEQVLVSYNLLILILILFLFLMLLLVITNIKGFNKIFGYEIFITGPMIILIFFLIKEIFAFKNNPQSSLLSYFSLKPLVIPVVSLIIGLLGILTFFMVLYVGGIFSNNPPENNTATIINFIIIILFIIISSLIYTNSQNKDNNTLKTFPKALQDMFLLRTKYTIMFALFVLLVTLLYFYNPWGLMTNYGGPVVFFTLFVGIIMVIMITIYQYYLANPSKANLLEKDSSPLVFLIKGFYILGSLGVSFGLIFGALLLMGVFDQDASKSNSWGHLIFNFILFSAMLGIIYKLANAGGFLDKNPYYRLILNTLLYIPCIFTTIISPLFNKSETPPNPFEIKMLILSLVLLVGYFLLVFLIKPYIQKVYLKQGGKQLINQPVSTDVLTNVSSYQLLSGNDKLNYQYAISFWFYLDAFSTSNSTKMAQILSYGENPSINYSSANNTLYIMVNQPDTSLIEKTINNTAINNNAINNAIHNKTINDIELVKTMPFGKEIDANGNRIIYTHPDVKLQKWNHIVLNYSGGTLDIFYNGMLVKSAIEVVPYIKFNMLTIGSNNGVSGNVANLMYFKTPLDILKINTLYVSLKNNNPPIIPENK